MQVIWLIQWDWDFGILWGKWIWSPSAWLKLLWQGTLAHFCWLRTPLFWAMGMEQQSRGTPSPWQQGIAGHTCPLLLISASRCHPASENQCLCVSVAVSGNSGQCRAWVPEEDFSCLIACSLSLFFFNPASSKICMFLLQPLESL